MIDETEIRVAYDLVYQGHTNLESATTLELKVRAELDGKKAELLALGVIDGKNAETREGQLRERLADHHAVLTQVQEQVAQARLNLTLAQLGVDRCKTLLRLYEVRPVQPDPAALYQP